VSDQGFNFNPPPRREGKKAFEPPPWERDQFEELARRREAEQVVTAAPAGETTAATEGVAGASQPEAPAPSIASRKSLEEDPRVQAMMVGLKKEEASNRMDPWRVVVSAGVVLASVGGVLVVWGAFAMAAARGSGAMGLLGGGVLVVFGCVFFGVGLWIALRILRQRGVL
jgi:hypothetical protein